MTTDLKPAETLYAYWEADGDSSYPLAYDNLTDAVKSAEDSDPVPEIGTYRLVKSSRYKIVTEVVED